MLPSWLQIDVGIGTRRGSRKHTLKIVVWYFVALLYLRSTQPPSSPGESRTLSTQGIQWNNSGNLSLVAAWSEFRWRATEIKWLWYLVAMVTIVIVETIVSWWLLMALRTANEGKNISRDLNAQLRIWRKSEVSMASLKESISFGHWTV